MKYYEDINIGETLISPEKYKLTEENIIEMGLEWDPIPIHIDKKAAKKTIFGDVIASTVHLFAIATKLSRTYNDKWAVVASLGLSDFKNHSPGYANDILYIKNTFIDKRVSVSKPSMGVVRYNCKLFKLKEELVFEFSGTALYKRNINS